MQSKHEQKNCPRCGIIFECKTGNIGQCQCSAIQLTVEETVYIQSKYEDCLCINCLQNLQKEYEIFKAKHIFNK
ncbi:MAG: cysteine-rich CWC family protein [Ferruginibacter sp.]|nr:cysteine-rich CWC family protein [Bacteroidota bacterium]MBX2920483.1 cysteine-rich CWC family protein [Ferruginibacter sp.]MCB0710359.1 cysteine-rich CWC family protein [Chitinophagaceae bacterium]MCC7379144.1 cysteine-rich CWC family protein [Chitinophagaceae bacterium]